MKLNKGIGNMRKIRLLSIAALSLALVSCGGGEGSDAPKGEALAKVAAPAGKAWVDTVSKTAEGGFLIGNPDAKIKLIEYAAVTCSHCAEFEEEGYGDLLGKYVADGRVSFEIRNFLLNPYDIPISIMTRCSGPETYLALTQQFYQNQRPQMEAMQKTDPATFEAALKKPEGERFVALAQAMGVIEFFKARGVSEDQAKTCLADPKNAKELIDMTEKAADPAGQYKVTGTPSFFLNGQQLVMKPSPSVWTQVKTALQNAGAR
jgi:protein-disulfide isomerase